MGAGRRLCNGVKRRLWKVSSASAKLSLQPSSKERVIQFLFVSLSTRPKIVEDLLQPPRMLKCLGVMQFCVSRRSGFLRFGVTVTMFTVCTNTNLSYISVSWPVNKCSAASNITWHCVKNDCVLCFIHRVRAQGWTWTRGQRRSQLKVVSLVKLASLEGSASRWQWVLKTSESYVLFISS